MQNKNFFKKRRFVSVENKDFQPAFTLAEMMVALLVLSLIMAAFLPVITKRSKVSSSASGIWSYASNNSDAYYGTGSTQGAAIGTTSLNGNYTRLYLNTVASSTYDQSHIVFANSSTTVGKLIMTGATAGNTVGPYNLGLGNVNLSTKTGNTAIGYYANTSDGTTTTLTGSANTALGYDAKAYDSTLGNGGDTALGAGSIANNTCATAIGYHALATGNQGTAVGNYANAIGSYSSAFGTSAQATGDYAFAQGNNAQATGPGAISIGAFANAASDYSIAQGYQAQALSNSTTAIGYGAIANNASSSAIGYNAQALGASGTYATIAVGDNSYALGDRAIAMGSWAYANGLHAITIGYNTTGTHSTYGAQYQDAIAIGTNATASSGPYNIAIGYGAIANSSVGNGLAVGQSAQAFTQSDTALGIGAIANGNDAATALGDSARASGDRAIAVGSWANSSGPYSLSIGYQANTNGYSYNIAIGALANTQGQTNIAIGYTAKVLNDWYGIAIGYNANASNSRSIALGTSANASGFANSIAIGYGATTTATSQIMLGTGGQVYIPGSLYVVGGVTGASWTASDKRLKNISGEYVDGLDKLRLLEPYNFTFKKDKKKYPQVGVMAQDLQKIFPNSVKKGEGGYFEIRKDEMFYAMLNSIKQLDGIVQGLVKDFKSLATRVQQVEDKILALIKVDQLQNKKIKTLESQNKSLESRIAKLEKTVKK